LINTFAKKAAWPNGLTGEELQSVTLGNPIAQKE